MMQQNCLTVSEGSHVDAAAMQLDDANFDQKNLSLAKIFIRSYLSTDWRYEMFNPRRKICKMFNPKEVARWATTNQGRPSQEHWCYYASGVGGSFYRIQEHVVSLFAMQNIERNYQKPCIGFCGQSYLWLPRKTPSGLSIGTILKTRYSRRLQAISCDDTRKSIRPWKTGKLDQKLQVLFWLWLQN